MMSLEEMPEIREPKPGRLLVVGLLVAAVAGFVVVTGVKGRASSEQDLAVRTRERAVTPVEVISPGRGAAAQELVLPGDIQAFSSAPIYARASGYVTAWYKDIGARVKKGETLADIDTPDLDQQLAQARADLANATANAQLAAATADRYHQLVARSIVSKQTDEEKTGDAAAKAAMLESSRANLARLEALVAFKSLTAPFDGIVTSRNVDVGALINAGGTTGTALFQVADIHRVRVYVRVPQAYVADLRDGMKALLQLPQYPGQSFTASVVGISNAITQESRTALVQLEADNPNGKLWPGTYAEVHFQMDANPDALRVPATALMFGEHGLRLATLDPQNAVVFKTVRVGRDIGTDVEIVSGLSAGDRLIDSPLETLTAGETVRVVNAREAAPKVVQASGPAKAN